MDRTDRLALDIIGMVAAVPGEPVSNRDIGDMAVRAEALTGVRYRHLVRGRTDTDGLCIAAAQRLLANLGWDPLSVDALVYVTQTPGIEMPSGAHTIHGALKLAQRCVPIQVNYACAGYVYGLWLASILGDQSPVPMRILVLAGDTISERCDHEDKATRPVFGDCGTATAVEVHRGALGCYFSLGTDPNDAAKLAMYRTSHVQMDGMAVFNFTLRRVPPLIDWIRESARGIGMPVDLWLFHQANKFMLDHLVKKCQLVNEAVPMNVGIRGNTSSASIPLLMCDTGLQQLHRRTAALVGFGAGWSWGAALVQLPIDMRCAEVITV